MRCHCTSTRLALLILSAVSACATTINGRVLDENGAPLAGARVRIFATASASVAGAASSDEAGVFHVEIPSDGLYRVTAEREGFFLLQIPSIRLERDLPLEVRLNRLQELTGSLSVNYSPPAIDPDQTAQIKVLDNREVLNVPVPASQDLRSSLPMTPGVVQDNRGQPHFNGADTASTNYRLNGFNISDPANGELTARLNVDAVQTLEWQASRFSPDKGKGSAGVLDIRTQMGDDHWRFGGTNFIPGLGTQGGVYLNHWSPRVIFSGPLKKGRAWFHNSSDSYYVANTVSELPGGQNRATSISGSNLTRFQWNVRDNQILSGNFLVNLARSGNTNLSFLNPAEATVDRHQSLYFGSLKDQFLFRGGLVEVGFANTAEYLHAAPQGSQPYVITPFGASGNFFREDRQNAGRQEWLINAFAAPRHWHGTHQLAIGADVDRGTLNTVISRHDIIAVRADNTVVRDVRFQGSPNQFGQNVEVYSYLQDKWTPTPGLTVEAGFRTQWDNIAGSTAPAPRIAAAWAPEELHGIKLSLGWGIYYDPLQLNTLALRNEQSSITTFFRPVSPNTTTAGFLDGHPFGLMDGGPVVTSLLVNPRDLRLPRFSMTAFSAEDRLPWNLYARLSLTARQGNAGPRFTAPDILSAQNIYVLGSIEKQRYRAAEIAVRRTFLSRYEWFAAYTRSSATSNAAIAYSVENPLFAAQAAGPLNWDAPNRFITWGWFPIDRRWFPGILSSVVGETDFQLLADYRTGFPFSVTNETGRLIGSPNSQRFPDYFTVNIALERKFPFRGFLWAFRAGLNNALDRENANVVNNDFDSPQYRTFGRGQARAVNVRLRFLGRK